MREDETAQHIEEGHALVKSYAFESIRRQPEQALQVVKHDRQGSQKSQPGQRIYPFGAAAVPDGMDFRLECHSIFNIAAMTNARLPGNDWRMMPERLIPMSRGISGRFLAARNSFRIA